MKTISLSRYREQYGDSTPLSAEEHEIFETEASDFHLPRRQKVSHKYSYGRALILAGALGYSGAAILAANACERSGAGLTQLMVPESIYPIAAARCDGAVVTPLPAGTTGGISQAALPTILAALEKADACAVGPGFGVGEEQSNIVKAILRQAECPLILDADGLTVCAGETELFAARSAPLLLTPHEGEFKRLGGELAEGRLAGALRFAGAYPNNVLILKGYGTLVCRGGEISVNPTGGPAMAKGGSGDVLCGILCALLAQGFEPLFAARCAVWLHGLSGDLAAGETGEYSLAPSDLIRFLPKAFQQITQKE